MVFGRCRACSAAWSWLGVAGALTTLVLVAITWPVAAGALTRSLVTKQMDDAVHSGSEHSAAASTDALLHCVGCVPHHISVSFERRLDHLVDRRSRSFFFFESFLA